MLHKKILKTVYKIALFSVTIDNLLNVSIDSPLQKQVFLVTFYFLNKLTHNPYETDFLMITKIHVHNDYQILLHIIRFMLQ